ncbi:MAG TPA: NAD(P)H-binding protein [Mycobacterium sp.]|uniref:SDR family oxidoreductase n=1 Tax=Mycobacterium sp. TaxID=1785 RepID=UPI002D1DD135|nr:NAD(P)H-binding protein [Mycobacterium sp.]HME79800.1 NAD(P)H-binding protein [Mycobacterium sp.]
MNKNRFLVVGATGHVGSKIAILLADKGYDVTGLVRTDGATIRDPHPGMIRYVTGDLSHAESITKAVEGIDVVISTANGIIPQKRSDTAGSVNEHALRLIDICEQAGVRRFVQSSTPSYPGEHRVPELAGKRQLEQRLQASTMQSIVVRNAAFMDVFLVMGGFKQATDRSAHATVNRNYGFTKLWGSLTGNLVEKRGLFLAPGGAGHGTPIIATRDVAEMIVGAALYPGTDDLLIEAGGPQWLTWRQIADTIATKTGREKVRIIPIPARLARLNQTLARPFSASAASVFALMGFVAEYQPHWDSADTVHQLGLPTQLTVADYLDLNYQSDARVRQPDGRPAMTGETPSVN